MPPATAYSMSAIRAWPASQASFGTGPAGARGDVARSRPSAPAAAARLIAAAANAVPRTPNRGMRTNEVKRAPAIAPAVLAAYRRPPAAPTCPACGARDRIRTGSVPPIRTAGAATSAKSSAQARGPAASSSAEKGNTEFQERVEKEWPREAIHPPAEQGASERQPGEECAHAGRHGINIDADHQGELLDPHDLIDERGGPRREEQRRRCREAAAARQPFALTIRWGGRVRPACGGCGTHMCGHRQQPSPRPAHVTRVDRGMRKIQ